MRVIEKPVVISFLSASVVVASWLWAISLISVVNCGWNQIRLGEYADDEALWGRIACMARALEGAHGSSKMGPRSSSSEVVKWWGSFNSLTRVLVAICWIRI